MCDNFDDFTEDEIFGVNDGMKPEKYQDKKTLYSEKGVLDPDDIKRIFLVDMMSTINRDKRVIRKDGKYFIKEELNRKIDTTSSININFQVIDIENGYLYVSDKVIIKQKNGVPEILKFVI